MQLESADIEFEWDEIKAASNVRKHRVTFELASTIFRDPRLLTTADLIHTETQERWLSIGWARNGAILSVVYLWSQCSAMNKLTVEDDEIPSEIDFSKGIRGLHHIAPDQKVFYPLQ